MLLCAMCLPAHAMAMPQNVHKNTMFYGEGGGVCRGVVEGREDEGSRVPPHEASSSRPLLPALQMAPQVPFGMG